MWIHKPQNWPNFVWKTDALAFKLADVRHRQDRLLGRMEGRSSIARPPGIDLAGLVPASRDVESIVEMMQAQCRLFQIQ